MLRTTLALLTTLAAWPVLGQEVPGCPRTWATNCELKPGVGQRQQFARAADAHAHKLAVRRGLTYDVWTGGWPSAITVLSKDGATLATDYDEVTFRALCDCSVLVHVGNADARTGGRYRLFVTERLE